MTYRKNNKELNQLIENKLLKFVKNKKRKLTKKELKYFQEMQLSNDENIKSVSNVVISVESGEILYSSYEWNLDLDKLFVTCLNYDRKNKLKIPIKNHLFVFINTSLNYMPIRSHLVSQPNRILISNNE